MMATARRQRAVNSRYFRVLDFNGLMMLLLAGNEPQDIGPSGKATTFSACRARKGRSRGEFGGGIDFSVFPPTRRQHRLKSLLLGYNRLSAGTFPLRASYVALTRRV